MASRDELVSELQAVVRPLDEETAVDRLHDAGPQVRVEDAVAPARPRRRPRRQAIDEPLERRRDGRELAPIERPTGRCQEPQDAPALRGAQGQARVDELFERRAEGQAGQLPARGEDLLRDERVAAGPLGHEEEGRGGRALALDLGDELGQVEPVERAELELGRRVGRAGDRRQLREERMAAREAVRAVGHHEAQPGGPRHAREERRQPPGPGVGVVEVLEDEQDRPALPCPLEQALDRLADPGAAALRRDRLATGVPNLAREARRDGWQEPRDRLGAGSRGGPQLVVAEAGEPGAEALDDRPERGTVPGRDGGAPDHLEWLWEPADAPDRLADEPAHADATAPRDEQARAATVGGGLERDGEVG